MSKIDGANLQIGESGTATQNCTVTANGDGSFTLARGNIGATTQDLLTIDSAGYITSSVNSGFPIQSVRTDDGEVATGTTTFPNDDTIPQITEGNEFQTVIITPTSATNKLVIEANINFSSSVDSTISAALFQDAVANALAAKSQRGAATVMDGISFNYEMVAGTTSAITFRIRAGGASAGTITFNGASGARKFGGVVNSYIKVTEVTP